MTETLKKKSGFLHEFMDMLESVFTSATVVLLIFTFLFRIVTVDGTSMCNTLQNDDKLIVNHMFYEPERGDIIVFESGIDGLGRLVKRVIALPGQTVDIDVESARVKVDGEYIDEPYVFGVTYPISDYDYPVTVPSGCVFVMGDNRWHEDANGTARNHSTDSRDELVGFVDCDKIIGKVLLRFFPFSSLGFVD